VHSFRPESDRSYLNEMPEFLPLFADRSPSAALTFSWTYWRNAGFSRTCSQMSSRLRCETTLLSEILATIKVGPVMP